MHQLYWSRDCTTASGVKTFMLYNTRHSLCLHGSKATDEVLLKKCDLKSDLQQWLWMDRGMLMCVGSSKCLLATQRSALKTEACVGLHVEASALMWDCNKDRLISRNTSMFLSVDGRHLTLSHSNKDSKWKSLDTDDICGQSLSKWRLKQLSSKQYSQQNFVKLFRCFKIVLPLGYKRASDDDPEEAAGNEKGQWASMTEEQREYLRWFYRTEERKCNLDPPSAYRFTLISG